MARRSSRQVITQSEQDAEQRYQHCRTIATFMFKGGVYKSTTTIAVASVLSDVYKKKVAIIDADSQCNTTRFFEEEPSRWEKLDVDFKKKIYEHCIEEAHQLANKLMDDAKWPPVTPPKETTQFMHPHWFADESGSASADGERPTNLYDALKPSEDREKLKTPLLQHLGDSKKHGDIGLFRELYLLRGSPKLAEFATGMTLGTVFHELRLKHQAVKELLRLIAVDGGYDFIFVDLGPNHEKLNS
eukprot:3935061-Rhodomonas_salina.1